MTMFNVASLCLLVLTAVTAQQVVSDPGYAGPEPELVHLYYDQWPTGMLRHYTRVTLLMIPRNRRFKLWKALFQLSAGTRCDEHTISSR